MGTDQVTCPICEHEPCLCEKCPCCGEKDNDGVFHCEHCHKPACCCCACNGMHFGCEAQVNGGLYIGPRPEREMP